MVASAFLSLALLASTLSVQTSTLPLPAGHRSSEANIAISPRDPREILVVARDEDTKPLVSLRAWRSRDGGRSFRASMVVDKGLDGEAADGSDPVAVIDQRGRPAPAFLALRYGTADWETRIMLGDRVVVSNTYGPPIPSLGEIYGPRVWHDKPWAAIDPRDGRAYVSWTQRSQNDVGPIDDVVVATAAPGTQFAAPRVLGSGDGSQPVLGRGSTVIVVWYRLPNLSDRARIMSSVSHDRGATWSAPNVVARNVYSPGYAPFPTVARTGAGFAACWQQYAPPRHEQIACARSANGGIWSRPTVIGGGRLAGDADQPALAAGPDGRLWLAFYRFDRRSTWVELWGSASGGRTWQRRGVLMRRAVPRSGYGFLGDYQGLAATSRSVIAAFVMPVRARAFRQEVVIARAAVEYP